MIDLKKLLNSGTETEILEFKEAKSNYDTDKLGRYFSALSNEANLAGKDRAFLLMGVNDCRAIIGTSISDSQINGFKHEIANHTSPTINFIDVERSEINGKMVLCFVIPAAPQGMPIAWKNHYYGREGESLGGLDIGEIERIRNQTIFRDWSIRIVEDATIEDLSPRAIDIARKQYAEKNRRLFNIQRERFFPLPDFNLTGHAVTLKILGKILDMNYAKKLANSKELSLQDVIQLDNAQKKSAKTDRKSPLKRTFDQTFDQKIEPKFKQHSSYQRAKLACSNLYNIIVQDPTITKQAMQAKTGIKATTLKNYLKYLTDAGMLKRIGPDNGGRWEVLG